MSALVIAIGIGLIAAGSYGFGWMMGWREATKFFKWTEEQLKLKDRRN